MSGKEQTNKRRHPRRRLFNGYLGGLALGTALICGATLTLNTLVDPLWFGDGNRISGRNYIFNERIAKLNLLLQDPGAYDCLIFGSSRVTLFDQTQIRGHRCANLAFSAGKVVEFLAYAHYIADRGVRPKLVIVGVDDFNFLDVPPQPIDIPAFVQNGEAPPDRAHSYLSFTALDFSQRSLRGLSVVSRYYDTDFVGKVFEDAPQFRPPVKLAAAPLSGSFDPGRVALYRELRETFPEAEFWGYVPPISAWKVAETRYLPGILDGYLDAIPATAALFDRLYDFSAPSAVTERADNTYDGSHYYPAVNAVIAERLQADSATPPADGFGLPVHAMRPDAYRAAFETALEGFLSDNFPQLAHRPRQTQAAAR